MIKGNDSTRGIPLYHLWTTIFVRSGAIVSKCVEFPIFFDGATRKMLTVI